ncbi:hypothetical protein GRI38_11230 [Altererythrobacter aurantiacus]|uniref:Uncharacterized protein n=1 Tax=Parapontixanthobacter aurantiacus TaxID=1463599 RepID=A0A844ZHI0_9SPHN|nr:hypothetical protein [Parapontixanthobacter aurantiacus]MXO86596.1 hypothetical protein [Parapontixanthobacter aurantiacus]
MKRYPPPLPPPFPIRRRRIPAFHPVPVSGRKDGWTHERQAAFIGYLAETRSVAAAAQAVSMAREGAYRLRAREGAASFARAWDAALGKRPKSCDPAQEASPKVTDLPARYRAEHGLIVTIMYRGRYVKSARRPDNSALLQHLAQLDRALRMADAEDGGWDEGHR